MKHLVIISFFVISVMGCNRIDENDPCYNESITHNNACTKDCPGFEGCDGKTYCNECEAARQGIGPK